MKTIHILLVVIFTALFPFASGAEDGRRYLEVSGGYRTGDFGSSTRSDLYYLSPVLGFVSHKYDFSVTVPYLSLSAETSGQRVTEKGIGDIILRGGMALVPETERGLSLNGSLAVKLPTADEDKGLGTGKTDYGAFVSVHQRMVKVKLSMLAGYIKVGDPSDINFNDVYLYGVGISKVFGRTDIYTSFEGRRAIVPGAENPQELNFGFFHILSKDYSLRGITFFGLNNGGPDFGLNLGLARWF